MKRLGRESGWLDGIVNHWWFYLSISIHADSLPTLSSATLVSPVIAYSFANHKRSVYSPSLTTSHVTAITRWRTLPRRRITSWAACTTGRWSPSSTSGARSAPRSTSTSTTSPTPPGPWRRSSSLSPWRTRRRGRFRTTSRRTRWRSGPARRGRQSGWAQQGWGWPADPSPSWASGLRLRVSIRSLG